MDSTWKPADSFDCLELIEAFESGTEAADEESQTVTVSSTSRNTPAVKKAVLKTKMPTTISGCPRKRKTSKLEPVSEQQAMQKSQVQLIINLLVALKHSGHDHEEEDMEGWSDEVNNFNKSESVGKICK